MYVIISPLCGTQHITSFFFAYMIISPVAGDTSNLFFVCTYDYQPLSLSVFDTTTNLFFCFVYDYQPLSASHNNKLLFCFFVLLLVYNDYKPHKIRTQQVTSSFFFSLFLCIWLMIVIVMIISPIIFGRNNKPLCLHMIIDRYYYDYLPL